MSDICCCHYLRRKRKKSCTSGDARGRGTAGGDEDADAARCGAMRLPSQVSRLFLKKKKEKKFLFSDCVSAHLLIKAVLGF